MTVVINIDSATIKTPDIEENRNEKPQPQSHIKCLIPFNIWYENAYVIGIRINFKGVQEKKVMNELYTLDPRNIQNNHSNNNGKVKLRKKPVRR